MKKLSLVSLFLFFIALFAFSEPENPEEIDYLLFLPDESRQFVNEAEAMIKEPEPIKESEHEIVISSADDREPVNQEAAAEKSGAKFPLLFLFPLLLLVLIAALVYLLSRRKKSPSAKPAVPVKTKPVKIKPVKVKPVKTKPVKVAPVKAEPVKTAPVKSAPTAAAAIVPKTTVILDEEIRRRAYELFQEHGSQHGNMARDWYDALNDVCAKYKSAGYRIYFEGDHWWAS